MLLFACLLTCLLACFNLDVLKKKLHHLQENGYNWIESLGVKLLSKRQTKSLVFSHREFPDFTSGAKIMYVPMAWEQKQNCLKKHGGAKKKGQWGWGVKREHTQHTSCTAMKTPPSSTVPPAMHTYTGKLLKWQKVRCTPSFSAL